jgi:3-oxoacyl-[acyl-carrier protein] reductase
MDLGIRGRWALVGGASKGLGFGCAMALVEDGVNVVIVSRGQDALSQAAQKLQLLANQSHQQYMQIHPNATNVSVAQIVPVAADITTEAGRKTVFAQRRDFDILVTNAGGPPGGDFRKWDRDTWIAAIDANMLTPIELIKSQIDGMCSRGFGRIVNITSSAVKSPIDILGLSNGARAGLTGFVAGVARSDIAAKGVTINNLLPGIFDTARLQSNFETQAKNTGLAVEQVRAKRIDALPGKRLGNLEEFGKMCAFICSAHASYLNGQNILLDGGSYPGTF